MPKKSLVPNMPTVKRRAWWLAIPLLVLSSPSAHADDEPANASSAAAAELDAQAAILRGRDPTLGIRGVLRLALEAGGHGGRQEIVDDALGLARQMQVSDRQQPDFGNFRWRLGDAAVTDENAVEFAMQLASLLRLEHAKGLSPRGRELLDAINRDAIAAVRRHAIKPGYTNIALMKIWNCLALGQVYDERLAQEGAGLWRDWLDYTRKSGITEYASPTYYGVDLDSLALITRHAHDPLVRAQSAAALRYVWTSIAAQWFGPAQRLSGPHSRDYDYLRSRGYLDEHLRQAGWLDRAPATEGAGWLPRAPREHLRVFRDACRWNPPPQLRSELAAVAPRFVVERFGEQPWQRATNHVGATLTIGIAGECRGAEDKSLAINLPGDARTPNVTLVFDGRGDPYGTVKEPQGDEGHRKARHLKPFLIASQRGTSITSAWLFDPALPRFQVEGGNLTGLAAHLLVPNETEIWHAGAALEGEATLAPAAVVFLRKEKAAVGIRFVAVENAGDTAAAARYRPPTGLHVRCDGGASGAKRLTAVFAEQEPVAGAVLVLDIEARESCDDEEFARFRGEFVGRMVEAVIDAGRLRVTGGLPLEADIERFRRLVCEPLLPAGRLLEVNGRDVGSEALMPEPNPTVR